MIGQVPVSILFALACGQLASAAPADPTITPPAVLPRQNNDRFIGWVEANGTWFSDQCDQGLTWYQAGSYGQCCPTTLASCYAATACVKGSLIYPYSDRSSTTTIACTDNFNNKAFSICNTAFIFENFGDSNPKTDIVCGASSVNWSYYRKIPASATEIVSSQLPSSAIPVSTAPGAASPTSRPTGQKSSGSKAWIAGAVVGPIVGLALIGGIVFFLLRRKRKTKPTTAAAAGGSHPAGVAEGQQPYTDAKPQVGSPTPGYGQTAPGYAQEPYNQYGQQPMSPAPQYTAPYNGNANPGPEGHYIPDQKTTYQHNAETSHPEAAELGGASSPTTAAGPASYTAELPAATTTEKK